MNLVNKININVLIEKHNSDYYYKSFKTRTHLFLIKAQGRPGYDPTPKTC